MPKASYTMQPFTDDDWPNFEGFAKQHFGFSHIRERKFNEHWFGKQRYGAWNARKVVGPDGSLAGLTLIIGNDVKLGDQTTRLSWISNTAVTEDAQKSGAGAMLFFWAHKSFPMVGSISGNENSAPISDLLGVKIPGVFMERFLFLHSEKVLELCMPEMKEEIRKLLAQQKNVAIAELDARETVVIPDDYEEFWSRCRKNFYLTTERTRDFLEWRYVHAPYIKYSFLEIRKDGRLSAFAVLRFQAVPNGQVCRIVDFVSLAENAAPALSKILETAQSKGCIFTDFFAVGSIYTDALVASGLTRVSEEPSLNAVPHLLSPVEHRSWSNTFHLGGSLAKSDMKWRNPKALYFTKGDGDRDWPTSYDLENPGMGTS